MNLRPHPGYHRGGSPWGRGDCTHSAFGSRVAVYPRLATIWSMHHG